MRTFYQILLLVAVVLPITLVAQPVNDEVAMDEDSPPITFSVTDNDGPGADPASVDLDVTLGGRQILVDVPGGIFEVDNAGNVTFTPDLNFFGTVTRAYAVGYTNGDPAGEATIIITVNSVNDLPVAGNDLGNTTPRNTPITIAVMSNDSDVEGLDPGSIDLDQLTSGVQNTYVDPLRGTWSASGGAVTFTPLALFVGTATATYTISDTDGAVSNVATIEVAVTAVNEAPTAVNDAASTTENVAVTIAVLANDTDDVSLNTATVDLDPSVGGIQQSLPITGGDIVVNSSGVVTFTPSTGFTGATNFQYTVQDGDGLTSNIATVTITVSAANQPPVAVNDAVSTPRGVAVNIPVTANDTDPDGSIDAATVDINPALTGRQTSIAHANGTATVDVSGIVTFTPNGGFTGIVTLGYTVNDNAGLTSNVADIVITVTAVNEAPVAVNDAVPATEDVPVTFNILANDTDDNNSINPASVDLDPSSTGQQTTLSVAGGTITVAPSGVISYSPTANYNGTFSFQYTVADTDGQVSNPATVTFTVAAVNDPPVANNDATTTNEDTPVTLTVTANDTDIDGTIDLTSVDIDVNTPGIQQTLSTPSGNYSVSGGVVTFTPALNFSGAASIEYTVRDNQGATSNNATITITVVAVNDPPVAVNDAVTIDEDNTAVLNVVNNDSDPDGTINAASVDLNLAVAGIQSTFTVPEGNFSVNNTGIVTFVPANNFFGTVTISYTVNDNIGATSNPATITITVNPVNDPPIAGNDVASTPQNQPVTLNLLSNDVDIDGTLVPGSVDLIPATPAIDKTRTTVNGSFVVDNDGVLTFTPVPTFSGTESITYTVRDNLNAVSNEATISILVNFVNTPPVANDDVATTSENTPVTLNILANDTDDGSIVVGSVDLNPSVGGIQTTRTMAEGTFTVTSGVLTFTPAPGFNGTATVQYTVNDDVGITSNVATVTINVSSVNDPPVFNEIPNQRVLRNSAETTVTITGISPGPQENEQVTLSATSGNTTLIPNPVINYNGTAPTAALTFKPQQDQSGSTVITVRAVDAGSNEFTRTFTIDIVDVAITSTPELVAIAGEAYTYNITTTADIPETLTLAAVQKPAWASITSTSQNQATFGGTPPLGAASATVVIHLLHNGNVVDQQEFTLSINQRPTSTNFGIQTDEDVPANIDLNSFTQAYSDPDGNPLYQVMFTQLPLHGMLAIGNSPIANQTWIQADQLGGLVYTPVADYNGRDTIYFRVRDEYSAALNESYLHIVVSPVNDAPRITFIESSPLEVDIGRETEHIVSPGFELEDPENDEIVSAEIGFRRPNFNTNHDVLSFTNTPKIRGTYDDALGVLSLTGAASVEEYEEAIRSITYTYAKLSRIVLDPRTIYVTVSDGTSRSEAKERPVRLVFSFVDLKIPQVFTPDGNAMNDVWPFESGEGLEPYTDAIIRVFDKRGSLVFETTGFDNPWDGRKDGSYVPRGTYFYVIDLRYGNISYKGSLTILRDEQ